MVNGRTLGPGRLRRTAVAFARSGVLTWGCGPLE
jgi:hypothetical protein